MEKIDVVKHILRNVENVVAGEGCAWAPANVALCKYWGKRNVSLNLPVTSSLSLSLGKKGTFTKIAHAPKSDDFWLNGATVPMNSSFALRLQKFLDLFRGKDIYYRVETESTVPVSAGFASSASGFAALILALNNLYAWNLPKKDLSILARLGSGSACRSLWHGFVEWQKGDLANGMDSHGIPLPDIWPELRVGVLCFDQSPKKISSTLAMQLTVETSSLYSAWHSRVYDDLRLLKQALLDHDFELLGRIAEGNARAMHAVMSAAQPPIVYSISETFQARHQVWEVRKAGIPVFFTQDAGANLQLLFLAKDEREIAAVFPKVEVIAPFPDYRAEQVILVNDQDVEIGIEEKLLAHVQGKLHRAFSVFIARKNHGKIELLLQQRNVMKYHSGGLWSNACCGHPRPGESVIAGAKRRLREEMGIDVELKDIGSFCYRAQLDANMIEHELDHVLIGEFCGQTIVPDADEVQNYKWESLPWVQQELRYSPYKYSTWLAPALMLASNDLYRYA